MAASIFSEAIFGPRVFFQRDIHSYWYPHIETVVREVLVERTWPLWNPYVAFGAPLLADPNVQLLYPLTWLNLVLSPAAYYKLFVFGHSFLAASGVCVLARAWGLSRPSAFLAGALACASGPFVSAASLFHHYAGAAWLPWVLLFLEKALARRSVGAAVGLGVAVAMQLLAGSADLLTMTVLVAAARAIVFVVRSRLSGREMLSLARVGALSVVLAVALAAAQWIPVFERLTAGSRLLQGQHARMYWSVHPASLADLVIPRLTADLPLTEPARLQLFEGRAPLLVSTYLGAAAALLAVAGALGTRGWRRAFVLGCLAVFLLASLGRHTVFYRLLSELPPFSVLRYPAKFLIAGGFLAAFLAGDGFELWQRAWTARGRMLGAWLAGILLVAAVGLLVLGKQLDDAPNQLLGLLRARDVVTSEPLGPLVATLQRSALVLAGVAALLWIRCRKSESPRWASAALVVAVIADVAVVARGANRLAPPELLRHAPPILDHIQPRSAARVYVRPYALDWLNRQLTRRPKGWDPEWAWALGVQEMLWPPAGARWGVRGSYDGDFTGMASPTLSLLSAALEKNEATPAGLKLLQLGGVTHVVGLDDLAFGGLRHVAQLASVWTPPVRLYQVMEPLPLAYLVGGARRVAAPEALELLVSPGFDPRREVILSGESGASRVAAGFGAAVRSVLHKPDRVVVDATLSAPGFLVLLQSYDPGWKATVDGSPAPVLEANALFQAVPVAAGTHRVEIRYRPRSLLWGLALSMGGAAATLAYGLARWWRSRLPRLIAAEAGPGPAGRMG